jgi:hypothetical protein
MDHENICSKYIKFERTHIWFLHFESMEGQVHEFVSLHTGSLWFYVPIGSLMTLIGQSYIWRTRTIQLNNEVNLHCWKCSPVWPCPFKVSHAEYEIGWKSICSWCSGSNSRAIYETKEVKVGKLQERGKVVVFNKYEFPPLPCKGKEKKVHKHQWNRPSKRDDVVAILPHVLSSIGNRSYPVVVAAKEISVPHLGLTMQVVTCRIQSLLPTLICGHQSYILHWQKLEPRSRHNLPNKLLL